MTSEKAVGYIGLGNIGKPSAAHLFKLDRPVVVFDLVEAAVAEMVELGARAASDLADIAASCDHIGICVRDGAQVESLLYGDAGLLAHAAPSTVIAIHSTVDFNLQIPANAFIFSVLLALGWLAHCQTPFGAELGPVS